MGRKIGRLQSAENPEVLIHRGTTPLSPRKGAKSLFFLAFGGTLTFWLWVFIPAAPLVQFFLANCNILIFSLKAIPVSPSAYCKMNIVYCKITLCDLGYCIPFYFILLIISSEMGRCWWALLIPSVRAQGFWHAQLRPGISLGLTSSRLAVRLIPSGEKSPRPQSVLGGSGLWGGCWLPCDVHEFGYLSLNCIIRLNTFPEPSFYSLVECGFSTNHHV